MKYNIGDTVYWVESSCNFQKQVPCTMCFGKKVVTIILGDDSQTKIECGACERGMDRSTGFMTVWEPNARIESGKISGVSTKGQITYEIGYRNIYETSLFSKSEDAEAERKKQYEIEVERAKEWFKQSFHTCSKKQVWSARYHKDCIKRAERDIEWHQLRLGMIKIKEVKSE